MSNGSGSRVMHKKTRTIKFSAKIMSKFVVPCIDSETDENSRSHRHQVQVGQNLQVQSTYKSFSQFSKNLLL